MNYTELTTNINEECEFTFPAGQIALFTQQAEKLIYNSVHVPSLRKGATGSLTEGSRFLSTPVDFVWADSLSIDDGAGNFSYLVNKDYNFMREAYPNDSVKGTPKYYGYLDDDTLVVGPVPDAGYVTTLYYGYYPESIVTASNTWLGDNFGNVLLNAALVEAARFQKQEQDIIETYKSMLVDSLQTMKNVLDGKRKQDVYREGQFRQPVR